VLHLHLVFNYLVQSISSIDPPRLSPHAEKRDARKVVRSGSVVHLSCPVENFDKDELFIEWLKDGETLGEFDRRIRKTSGGALKIKDVNVDDTGRYICKVINGFGSIEIETTLIVLGKPLLTDVSTFQNSIVHRKIGENIKFKCVSSGYPRPLLTWFHNGHMIRDRERTKKRWTLTLNELKIEDSGNYTCIAFNSYGNASSSFTLEVMGGRRIEIRELYPGNTTLIEGGKVAFNCRVVSDIKPHIQWLKQIQNDELKSDVFSVSSTYRNNKHSDHILNFQGKRFKVLKEPEAVPQKDGSFVNKLTISNIKIEQSGQYSCLAASSYGYDFKSAFLMVLPQAKPLPPVSNHIVESSFPLWMIVLITSILVFIIVLFCACCRFQRNHQKRNNTNVKIMTSTMIPTSPITTKTNRTSINYETNIVYSQAPSSSISPCLNSELTKYNGIKDNRSSNVSSSNYTSAPKTFPSEYFYFPEGKSYGYLC
ncbi:fibroblast growth factor receptor-like 1, partial [Dinothrombium tinctorium]